MIKFKKIFKQYLIISLIGIAAILAVKMSHTDHDLVSLFPLNNYDQTISTWIKPEDQNYDKSLLSADMQQKRMEIFYDHYFGSLSPWNADYVSQILRQSPSNELKMMERSILDDFSNKGKPDNQIGYGENLRPHTNEWINEIANNVNISQFDDLTYQANNRGIAVDNLHARALPTDDVHFYSHKLAGQGYPFDNLQMSSLWVGTPVYIIGETRDHAWMLVITPDYIGWVKSSGIARANNSFINKWTSAAKNNLVAITHTQTSLVDDKRRYLFSAYVGSVFPKSSHSAEIQIMVPVVDADHNAVVKNVVISPDYAAVMPIAATPHNFSNIMSTMIGRPYGWGGMYFYNDCSAELKSVLTPFGIWLPRHSADQVAVGKMVDMTAASQEKRLSYLMENGQRFLTIIYVGGHVVMYVGAVPNPNKHDSFMAMTYQNAWGLSPHPATRRSVIGKSVLFPLLAQYPEDISLVSQAGKKYFQVSYLGDLPSNNNLIRSKAFNIRTLMYPEMYLFS